MNKLSLNYCLVTQNLASIIEDSTYDSDRFPDVSDSSGDAIEAEFSYVKFTAL